MAPPGRDDDAADVDADAGAAARARAWRHGALTAVCDVVEPWAHGFVARATAAPDVWDYNVVVVRDDPPLDVDELTQVADRALDGLAHRRLDFDDAAAGERLRPALERRGWRATRLAWMLLDGPRPDRPDRPAVAVAVEPASHEAVAGLRRAWHREELPDTALERLLEQTGAIARRRGVRVLAAVEGGAPVAYCELLGDGSTAEIESLYVSPARRGRGLGTALVQAALAELGDAARDVWIVADDEGRARRLYARLGFRPAWTAMQLLLVR